MRFLGRPSDQGLCLVSPWLALEYVVSRASRASRARVVSGKESCHRTRAHCLRHATRGMLSLGALQMPQPLLHMQGIAQPQLSLDISAQPPPRAQLSNCPATRLTKPMHFQTCSQSELDADSGCFSLQSASQSTWRATGLSLRCTKLFACNVLPKPLSSDFF